jgi:multidrug efflux pump subunit AcrA (membrane-fusion protein)
MSPDQHQPSTSGKKTKANLLRLLLPFIVVIISASVAVWMMQSGPKAKPRTKTRNAVLVDVRPIELGPQTTTVRVMGTVKPQREVALKPRVSGEIIKVGDKLIPGGRFNKGEELLAIDPIDYQLVVRQLASEVARVESDTQVELGRQRVALKEYELLGESVSEVEKTLMLREPQLENNRALLEGTRARLEQAQLDLKRTSVRSPFNAVVMSREVNLGTRVSPSTTLATLVGSDSYWVEAPIPASQLQWISISQEDNDSDSPVRKRMVAWRSCWRKYLTLSLCSQPRRSSQSSCLAATSGSKLKGSSYRRPRPLNVTLSITAISSGSWMKKTASTYAL